MMWASRVRGTIMPCQDASERTVRMADDGVKIVNQDGDEITMGDVDLEKGYLKPTQVVKQTHPAVPEQQEKGHSEPKAVYLSDGSEVSVGPDSEGVSNVTDGDFDYTLPEGDGRVVIGKEVRWVVDQPYVSPQDAWDEYEEAQQYVLYTEDELADMAAERRQQARSLAAVSFATMMAPTLTDKQAAQVPALYDEWSGKGVEYKVGDRLTYGEDMTLYKVIMAHTSQPDWTPDAAPSLFAKVLPGQSGEVGPWEQPGSTNGYKKGDRVTHDGHLWESTSDNNVWEPGAVGAPWKDLGENEG